MTDKESHNTCTDVYSDAAPPLTPPPILCRHRGLCWTDQSMTLVPGRYNYGRGGGGQWWSSIGIHISACVVTLLVRHASPQIPIHSFHTPHLGPTNTLGLNPNIEVVPVILLCFCSSRIPLTQGIGTCQPTLMLANGPLVHRFLAPPPPLQKKY